MTPKEEADWFHANPPPIHRFISIDKWGEYRFTLPPVSSERGMERANDPVEILDALAAIDASDMDCYERCKARAKIRYAAMSPEEKAAYSARANRKR
jgi:hypothetical protein